MKRILCILLSVFTIAASAQSLPPVSPQGIREALNSELEKDSILIGDQVWWVMPFQVSEQDKVESPELPLLIIEGVESMGPLVIDTLDYTSHLGNLRAKLRLTSFDSGSYALPYMPLYLHRATGNTDTLWFKGPLLYVNTIPVDTTGFVAKDLKKQIAYPIVFADIYPWIMCALFLGLLIFLLVRVFRRRKAKLPIFGKPKPKEPSHIIALRALDKIKAQQLWQSNKIKPYYTQITDTIRVYMRDRWNIAAMEQTSREMIDSLQEEREREPRLTDAVMSEIEEMLYLADLAKFAKYTPSADENENSLAQAVRFVNDTAVLEEENHQ